MKIKDMFRGGERVVSFEFFPPKNDKGMENLYATVEAHERCRPSVA